MPRKPGEALAAQRRKLREQRYDATRPARHMFYHSTEWRKLRKAYIQRYPLCAMCLESGITRQAQIVHHIIEIVDGGAPLDVNNLESLCKSCHNRVHSRGGVKKPNSYPQ